MEQIIFTTKNEIGLIGNEFMNVVNENNRLISNLYEAKFREKEGRVDFFTGANQSTFFVKHIKILNILHGN